MEDQQSSSNNNNSSENSGSSSSSSREPIRSRWTPKPEQILILESIFNSGMVNPPKEETVRIRKLLEKFGAVGDANVFYWFQNRRSRSRRRQRQLQATLAAASTQPPAPPPPPPSLVMTCPPPLLTATDQNLSFDYGGGGGGTCTAPPCSGGSRGGCGGGGGGGGGGGVDDVFSTLSGHHMQMGMISHHPILESNSSEPPILDFQSGMITVFINGVATQVPEGGVDVKAMFGEEVILVHSSGVPVPFNDFGISSFQSLQNGESYFLVPRFS